MNFHISVTWVKFMTTQTWLLANYHKRQLGSFKFFRMELVCETHQIDTSGLEIANIGCHL